MFRYPLAGIQPVKGTFEPAENPANAAQRELLEESGLVARAAFFIGKTTQITPHQTWHVYRLSLTCKQKQWTLLAKDDGGIELQFFWHALQPPPPDCGALYARVLNYARPQLLKQLKL